MKLIQLVSRLKGMEPKTFVYPGNLTGYIDQLGKSGFLGYRNGTDKIPKPISRINNLLREFNIFGRAEESSTRSQLKQPVCIPSGYFLNLRWGLRKKVPMNISLKRCSHIINDAIKNDRVLRLWTHPHNFINGDQIYTLLSKILEQVGNAVKKGDMINYTQKEYIEHISRTERSS